MTDNLQRAFYDSVGRKIVPDTSATPRAAYNCTRPANYKVMRKLYVLKNPPNISEPSENTSTARSKNSASIKTIQKFGKTYAIDAAIYVDLVASFSTDGDVFTLAELQERIKRIRQTFGIPGIAALDKSAVYGLKPEKALLTAAAVPPERVLVALPDYKVAETLDPELLSEALMLAVWRKMNEVLGVSSVFYFRRRNARYIDVQIDTFCKYEKDAVQMPTTASRAMIAITAVANSTVYSADLLEAGAFKPILVFMFPYSNNRKFYPIKVGVLFQTTSGSPRRLVFVPLQTDLEYLEDVPYLTGTTVHFPITNGGQFDTRDYFKSFENFFLTGKVSAA